MDIANVVEALKEQRTRIAMPLLPLRDWVLLVGGAAHQKLRQPQGDT
jgi:hypothetical protein